MRNVQVRLPGCLAVVGLMIAACTGAGDALVWDETVGESSAKRQALSLNNGFRLGNGLNLANGFALGNGMRLGNGINFANGMSLGNGISLGNGAVLDGVTGPFFDAFAGSDLEKWIDDDPAMRKKTLRYLVECALPGTATVRVKYRGTTESYAGVANLGPSLQAGMMTVVEQERVSACLLARLNARGNTVRIGLFGFYPGFNTVTAQDRADFPLEEAGFFGNIFLPEPKAYVCHQRYENITASKCKFRACVQPDGSCDCGVLNSANLTDAVAPCNNSLYIPSAHCKYVSASNGSYSGQTDCQADGRTWSNVITTRVALKPAGELCFDNMECTDGRCNSGQCAKPLGSTCGGNAECVSDICSGGICVGVPQGGACTTNTPLDLATELPILSSPMNQCASPAACHDGVCAGPSGSTCTASAACLNGTCSSGVCRTHSGGICAANSDCLTNTCLSGRCRSPRNATCSSEFACMPDAVCGVYNMCKGIGGASCSANGDCESYSCIGSICKASRGSCLSDAGCTSGLCSGGMCLSPAPPPKLPRGSACTTGTQCQSGKCSKGKCA